jgi:hypothetical protein
MPDPIIVLATSMVARNGPIFLFMPQPPEKHVRLARIPQKAEGQF